MSGRLWSLLVFGIVAAFPGKANLSRLDLRDAHLTGADRGSPDVSSDDLISANLSGAILARPITQPKPGFLRH